MRTYQLLLVISFNSASLSFEVMSIRGDSSVSSCGGEGGGDSARGGARIFTAGLSFGGAGATCEGSGTTYEGAAGGRGG